MEAWRRQLYNRTICHFGVSKLDGSPGRGSGRYPLGSGEEPYQDYSQQQIQEFRKRFSGYKKEVDRLSKLDKDLSRDDAFELLALENEGEDDDLYGSVYNRLNSEEKKTYKDIQGALDIFTDDDNMSAKYNLCSLFDEYPYTMEATYKGTKLSDLHKDRELVDYIDSIDSNWTHMNPILFYCIDNGIDPNKLLANGIKLKSTMADIRKKMADSMISEIDNNGGLSTLTNKQRKENQELKDFVEEFLEKSDRMADLSPAFSILNPTEYGYKEMTYSKNDINKAKKILKKVNHMLK